METAIHVKLFIATIFAIITSFLGVLTIPVLLLLACNIIDYATGIMSAAKTGQQIQSYKGINGIAKKVCMWLLIITGGLMDILLAYACGLLSINMQTTFFLAGMVTVWIICNELISILENITRMGVAVPKWLQPIVEKLQGDVDKRFEKESENEET